MSFLPRMTLLRRVSLLVILGLIGGLGLFGLVGVMALDKSTQESLNERLTMAKVVASHIDELLHHSILELQGLASSPGLNLADGNLEPEKALLREGRQQLVTFTHNIFLLDGQGQVLWVEPYDAALLGMPMTPYPFVSNAFATGRPSVSGLLSDPVADTPVVTVVVPIADSRGKVIGALGGSIDMTRSSIGGFLTPLTLGNTGYVELVDSNGVVMARTQPGLPLSGFEQSDHPDRFAALISEGQARVRTCHVCHEEGQRTERRRDVLAFAPLSTVSWGVALRQSEEEALALPRELQSRLIFLGGALLLLSLLLSGLVTRSVVRPVEMLTAAARRIAQGDLSTPVTVRGEDEVGLLARAFDDMRSRLKTSYDEIEGWNRELEMRVQRRAQEIICLLEMAKTLTSMPEMESLLPILMNRVVELMDTADSAWLFLYDEKSGKLVARSASGVDYQAISGLSLDTAEAIPGRAYTYAQPTLYSTPQDVQEAMKDLATTHRYYWAGMGLRLEEIKSAIGVPLATKNRVFGSLFMANFAPQPPFSARNLSLAGALADQIALATENARLHKEAEEAMLLREADRMKSQFISTVSHELRTPLTAIKGYSTSLLRDDVQWDEDTRREFLQIIDERADDLRQLIDNLLEMTKMEAGALYLQREPVLLSHLAQKVVKSSMPRARNHRFEVDFPSPFPVVEGDSRHIELVLHNLIENAVKYSPQGGQILIRGKVKGDRVLVSVSDNGVGIAPEQLNRVFERFYRVDNPLTRRTIGSGLGLSIAKGLVDAHGGNIWVESTPGKGSTFFFSLPLSPLSNGESADSGGEEA